MKKTLFKKGEIKLHQILIASIVLTALFATNALFYSEAIDNYTVNNYYEENLSSIESGLDTVTEGAALAQESLSNLQSRNLFDILGGIEQGFISILLLFGGSINTISNVFAQGIGVLGLGSLGATWILVAGTTVILVFLVIFLGKKFGF